MNYKIHYKITEVTVLKKFFTVTAAAAAVSVLCVSASASTAIANGTYNIDVESDSSMFKIINCDLTVSDGKLTASVTLSGTGYSKLFAGTAEQAASADESAMITYVENADGKYVYTFDIPGLDEPVDIAAFSTKKAEWYDRKLTFKSDKTAVSETNGTSSETPSSESGNPSTGAGMTLLVIPAAAAAVVFARKGRR